MNFIKIGSHSINMERVADIKDEEDADGKLTGRVLIFSGDHVTELDGAEAKLAQRLMSVLARDAEAVYRQHAGAEPPFMVAGNRPETKVPKGHGPDQPPG